MEELIITDKYVLDYLKENKINVNKLLRSVIEMIQRIGIGKVDERVLISLMETKMIEREEKMLSDISLKMENNLLKMQDNIKEDVIKSVETNTDKLIKDNKLNNLDMIKGVLNKLKEDIDNINLKSLEKNRDILIDVKTEIINRLMENINMSVMKNTSEMNIVRKEILDNIFVGLNKEKLVSMSDNIDNIKSFMILKIEELMTLQKDNIPLYKSLSDYVNKYKNPNKKGELGEYRLHKVLVEILPESDIITTIGEKGSGDYLIKRDNKKDILIETKIYSTNVPKNELIKFIKDVKTNKTHGIMLSHSSGIVGKKHFQIDIEDDMITTYLHNVDYNKDLIKLALNIIEILETKINNNSNDLDLKISKKTLESIYNEYNYIYTTKETMINELEIYYKNTKKNINSLIMNNLDELIKKHFIVNEKKKYVCQYCKIYTNSSKMSLARHQTKCKLKDYNSNDKFLSDNSSDSKIDV
jgi:hypothetical protein